LTTLIFSSTNEDGKIIEVGMLAPRIYGEDWEVDARLQSFGVTRAELLEVVRGVVAARADAVENDPLSAEGQFAYIYGTRYTRALFRSKGYLPCRSEGLEGVRHAERDLRVFYQSVDIAASDRDPRAVSGKGAGADRVIDAAQGRLNFPEESISRHRGGFSTGIWFLCISVDGDDVCAELSLPVGVGGGNFDGFIERILILRDGEWKAFLSRDGDGSDAAEFEPVVTRR
jgi:hypothetical protein